MASSTTEAVLVVINNLYESLQKIPGSELFFDYIKRSYQNDPFRVVLEALLFFFAVKYITSKTYKPNSNYIELTEKEIEDLVQEWTPEPLVTALTEEEKAKVNGMLEIKEHKNGYAVLSDGRSLQDWSSANFLGLHNNPEMKEKCAEAVKKYGVGTCGPSGFYGTVDVHLELQKELARILNTEAAIIYAQGYAAVASVIPAFSKKGDIIVADESVNFAIQRGLKLSRSNVYYFKHNDLKDLERILLEIDIDHKKKKKQLTRRFIVVEGLYQNVGDIVPLPGLIKLKTKYKYRLIVDESLSFGSIGDKCLGVSNYFGIPSNSIDVIAGSLSNSIGAGGGFCAGATAYVDHQVLSSQAYCYSASLPALLAVAAMNSLTKLTEKGPLIASRLRENVQVFRKNFSPYPNGVVLSGIIDSPLLFLKIDEVVLNHLAPKEKSAALMKVVEGMKEKGHLLAMNMFSQKDEHKDLQPSIKICISPVFTVPQVESFAQDLMKVVKKVMEKI